MARCSIHPSAINRTLDDAVCVLPPGAGCKSFSDTYKSTCQEFGILLADDCPRNVKAFTCQTNGTVLGIEFDSNTLTWRFPQHKAAELLTDIHTMIHGKHADLKQAETLAGRMCNFGQMCPFLKAFKRPMNEFVSSFNEDKNILLPVSEQLISDLRVWAAAVTFSTNKLPIPTEIKFPPLSALEFVSDAAGGHSSTDGPGVASIGLDSSGAIWFLAKGTWPSNITSGQLDEKGAAFASKMTTLELIGLFLPLLSAPHVVRGKHVRLGVDNVSVVYGWENRHVKGDLSASVLIRALHVLACYLECYLHVEHVPRCSSPASRLADSLTRTATSTPAVLQAVSGAMSFGPPKPLWDWLENPVNDWLLGLRLIEFVK